jgi:hypothetical protein
MIAALAGITNAPPGTITLIVALFFLSGLQLLFLGVLGEYVTAIHRQARGGAIVVERETLNLGAAPGASPAPREEKPENG